MKAIVLFLALSGAACATVPTSSPAASTASATAASTQRCGPSDATINATLWMQTSAEYQAITREVYGTALRTLDKAVADSGWNAVVEQPQVNASLPAAIIVDIDETVLDTSAHQGRLIRNNASYSEAEWHEFALHDISRPIPAALDFVRKVHDRGIRIFYVTNRIQTEKPALRSLMERYGYPFDAGTETLLTRGERPEWQSSDKSPRRLFVAERYRVLALFGDDLNDFVAATGKSLAERQELVERFTDRWGTQWFVIPNPLYGSWEHSMLGNARGLTPCQQYQKKIEAVREQ